MEAIQRYFINENWITFVIIFCMLLIALLKVLNPKHISNFFYSFALQGFFEKQIEDNIPLFCVYHAILYLYSVTIFSLFVSLIFFQESLCFRVYLESFTFIGLFLLFRLLIDFILEKLIYKSFSVRFFRYTKLGYFFTISLWALPVAIIYQYAFKNLVFLQSILIVFLIIRLVIILLNNSRLIYKNLFYFILYLCTLEIAPMLIIYRLA